MLEEREGETDGQTVRQRDRETYKIGEGDSDRERERREGCDILYPPPPQAPWPAYPAPPDASPQVQGGMQGREDTSNEGMKNLFADWRGFFGLEFSSTSGKLRKT